MSKDIKRVIVLGDLHLPQEDKRTIKAVESYIADHSWDEWLQLGDFMDFDEISRHSKENLRKVAAEGVLKRDYDYANLWLDKHQAIVRKGNPNCKFTLLQGNHDFRAVKLTELDPKLKGLIEPEYNLRFKERGIQYIKYWEEKKPYKIGHAAFAHGLYISANHPKKMVENHGVNIFYGHTHDVQTYSKVLMGNDKTIVGQSLGFLGTYNMDYIGHRPTNWQQAFGVFHFMPSGFFNYYVCRIFNHRFVSPEGKLYQG